jgi:hypothetical protein
MVVVGGEVSASKKINIPRAVGNGGERERLTKLMNI